MSTDARTPVAVQTEGTAVASLVLAVLSVAIGPFGFIPAIICGHIARGRIRRTPGLGGDGLALAGLIIGYVFALLTFLVVLAFGAFLCFNPVVAPPDFH